MPSAGQTNELSKLKRCPKSSLRPRSSRPSLLAREGNRFLLSTHYPRSQFQTTNRRIETSNR
jgi:hypothetical protein